MDRRRPGPRSKPTTSGIADPFGTYDSFKKAGPMEHRAGQDRPDEHRAGQDRPDGACRLQRVREAAESAASSWRVYADPVGKPFCLTWNVEG